MDTQVDLSGAKKGISPGASGWHDGGGSSCTAGFPVCSCQSFIAVSGILVVFLKEAQLHQTVRQLARCMPMGRRMENRMYG